MQDDFYERIQKVFDQEEDPFLVGFYGKKKKVPDDPFTQGFNNPYVRRRPYEKAQDRGEE